MLPPGRGLGIIRPAANLEVASLDRSFVVGSWHVDPLGNTLRRDDEVVRLEPKAMWVLATLARRPGEIVTRQELYEEVWRGRPVTDEVLSRCISLLRSALGDDAKTPAYIQTIPRVGYRLVASVSEADPAGAGADMPAAPAGPPGRPRRVRLVGSLVALAFAVAAVVVVGGYLGTGTKERPLEPPTGAESDAVAVLPFDNPSEDKALDYFSDGLTDELITSLSRVQGLKVIARTTSYALKGAAGDVQALGDRLGVAKVVLGSVRMDGRKLRISAQLVDTTGGYELWSRVYDARLEDVFDVQASIAGAIADAVLPTLGVPAVASEASGTRNAEAHGLYLRALHVLKRREEDPIRHAIDLLGQAIDLDGTYAAAYVELARAYALLPSYSREKQEEMFERAQAVLASGRERGAGIGDADQSVLAFMAFMRWDWLAAEESFRKAFAYNPNDPDLYQWYSQAQASLGHLGRSLEFAKKAWELDALSPVVNDRLAVAHLWVDQDEQAAHFFGEAAMLGLGQGANQGSQVVLLVRQGEFDEAKRLAGSLQSGTGGSTGWIGPFIAALQARSTGQDVQNVFDSADAAGIEPRYLFGALVLLGDFERALQLAMGLAAEPASLDVEFLFSREAAGMRRLPGFGALVEAIGLDQHWDVYGWPDQCRREDDGVRCTA